MLEISTNIGTSVTTPLVGAFRAHDEPRFLELIDAGLLRSDIDPSKIGQITSGVMDGLQLPWLLDPERVDLPRPL